MHDLVATLRRIAGTKPAKTPAGLLVTAGQLRHLADEIEQLLGRVDHLGRSRDEALEAVESLQARVADLMHDPKADSRSLIDALMDRAESARSDAEHLRKQLVEADATIRKQRQQIQDLKSCEGTGDDACGECLRCRTIMYNDAIRATPIIQLKVGP